MNGVLKWGTVSDSSTGVFEGEEAEIYSIYVLGVCLSFMTTLDKTLNKNVWKDNNIKAWTCQSTLPENIQQFSMSSKVEEDKHVVSNILRWFVLAWAGLRDTPNPVIRQMGGY